MQMKRIHIENFRSIKRLDFEPGRYCVLIGENNSGKSNILRALNLALGEMWPTERSFSEEDFHNQDTSNDIVIQVFFHETMEEWRNNRKLEIGGIELRCKAYKRKVGQKPAGTLTTDYYCIQPNGKQVQYPGEPLQKGKKPRGPWLPFRVTRELRDRLPLIYVGVQREYDRHGPTSRWSVLRRLLNEVNTAFLNDKTKVEVKKPDGSVAQMTRRQAFESAVKDAYTYLRTDGFVEIEQKLAANAVEQMGLDPARHKVELHFESHDPTNAFRSLQLYVEQMGITSPAGEVGAGLQSAIVVALFRTYEELKREGAVFALEEPEVFLHPHRARYFARVLRGLSEKGNQVFLTTHSPIFVQLDRPESIALVRRNEVEGTTVKQAAKAALAEDERKALRLMTEFDAQRNELFFARSVLLVEGATEKVLLPPVFQKMGHDPNRLGISVVEVGGKTKIPLFAKVCQAMEIPFVVLADHDVRDIDASWSDKRQNEEADRNRKHERWNRDTELACQEGALFWAKPDLESELGLPREESEKIDRAFEWIAGVTPEQLPGVLRDPIEKAVEMAR
ncbi:MAG: AAA family ATPase [Planctomycetes bacterium]|nr:AAA family ATPase [Planctomycetota bacterium]